MFCATVIHGIEREALEHDGDAGVEPRERLAVVEHFALRRLR